MNGEVTVHHVGPRPHQASRSFLLLLVLLTAGSILLVKSVGLGGNLWINELCYMLLIPLWLSWRGKWQWRESFRLQKPPRGTLAPALLIGASLWFANAVLVVLLEQLVGRTIGTIPTNAVVELDGVQTVLFLLGIVVLAPLCEEVFFRGFMQRAYEAYGSTASWIITGLLFGAMHVLNGMTAMVPATLLGLVLGYIACVTGSIWPAIGMHAMNNLISRIGLFLLPEIARTGTLSAKAYILGAAGLAISHAALQSIRRNAAGTPPIWTYEGAKPLWRSLSIWLAIAFLTFAACAELVVRAGIVAIPGQQAGHEARMHYGSMTGISPLISETVSQSEVGHQLVFRYEFKAKAIDAAIVLVDPQGTKVWEKEWVGEGLEISSGEQVVDLSAAGEWRLEVQGSAEEMDIKVFWRKAP